MCPGQLCPAVTWQRSSALLVIFSEVTHAGADSTPVSAQRRVSRRWPVTGGKGRKVAQTHCQRPDYWRLLPADLSLQGRKATLATRSLPVPPAPVPLCVHHGAHAHGRQRQVPLRSLNRLHGKQPSTQRPEDTSSSLVAVGLNSGDTSGLAGSGRRLQAGAVSPAQGTRPPELAAAEKAEMQFLLRST